MMEFFMCITSQYVVKILEFTFEVKIHTYINHYRTFLREWLREFEVCFCRHSTSSLWSDLSKLWHHLKHFRILKLIKNKKCCGSILQVYCTFTGSILWFDSIFQPSVLRSTGARVCVRCLFGCLWANAVLLHMRPEIINTLSDILRAPLC